MNRHQHRRQGAKPGPLTHPEQGDRAISTSSRRYDELNGCCAAPPVGQISCAILVVTPSFPLTATTRKACAETAILRIVSMRSRSQHLPGKKYHFAFTESMSILRPSRLNERGVRAVVTRREAGRRWTCRVAAWLWLARTNNPDADVKSCGPGLPMLRSSLPLRCESTSAAMGATKPVPRESAKQALKPSRREGWADPAAPVVPAPCFLFARGPWASADAQSSLRPLVRGGSRDA